MKDFETYLHERGYRMNTVRGIINNMNRFISWCKDEDIQPDQAAYTDLLSYIQYCQRSNNSKGTINQKITILKHYYHFLIACKKRADNPALEMRIRNQIKRVPYHLLSSEELNDLYKKYPANGITGKRNKAMLGLMIYQGVTTGELGHIELNDLKLEEGKIYIPAAARSNSRTLQLESTQVLQLQNYILTIRPVLIAMTGKQTDKLFMSLGKSERLSNSFTRMMRIIKKINPKAIDAKQIRASIITAWLKVYHIRQVQYMIGHRYVSSTEHYSTNKLQTLQEQLESLHPLG